MALFARGSTSAARSFQSSICQQCRRSITSGAALQSGHNRWSKIRHEKGAADAKKNRLRSIFSENITVFSKWGGANVDNNPQLAAAVAAAKKAGVPKATIETAIARGQSRTLSGVSLESMTWEVIVPPSVAVIVDIETDNTKRTLQDLNILAKRARGGQAATKFFFSRLGRVVFENMDGVGPDEIMDEAIEAGAEDIETDDEGNIIVWTQPNQTNQIVQSVGPKFDLKVLSADIIWSPNEDTRTKVNTNYEFEKLKDLVIALKEYPEVKAVYCNVERGDLTEEQWDILEENIDS